MKFIDLSIDERQDILRRVQAEKLQFDLKDQLIRDGIGFDSFKVNVNITPVSTTDPEIIEVEYQPVFNDNPYD